MQKVKEFLKALLGEARFGRMKRGRLFRVGIAVICTIKRNDLQFLARFFNTDKTNSHAYIPHYEMHFRDIRNLRLNILEIGVGGHKNTATGGASLRMWKYYFPRSRIYGIDIHDKRSAQERRISIFQGDQADAEFLHRVKRSMGSLHIVVDDGSHVESDVIASFTVLFPLLESRGMYAVEDMGTMPFFKDLASEQSLSHHIASIHFYRDLVIIHKR